MATGKQQLKFERNSRIRNRNNCDTDDGRTEGFDFMSGAKYIKE